MERLIAAKADVNSQDNRKVSCLMAAFRKGHVKVVSLLVQHVTQFPSDKDCQRHIKVVAHDKVINRIYDIENCLLVLRPFALTDFLLSSIWLSVQYSLELLGILSEFHCNYISFH